MKNRIELFLSTVNDEEPQIEIAYFGGSFTGLDLELQEEFLKTAAAFFPKVSGIRLSTRPDYINDDVLRLLKRYGVTTVELGVQSSCDYVLENNNRGHTFEDVKKASEKIREYRISLGHQMMLGMFKSDRKKDLETVSDIIKLSPDCVRIYPVITLKGTRLERLYANGSYKPYSVMEAAEIAKEAFCRFEENNIDVIRIGLHSSENLNSGEEVIAGPYHPAFGEIVMSLVYRDRIEAKLKDSEFCGGEFVFYCPGADISKAVGHKKMNSKYFKDKYNIRLKIKEI